MVLISIDPLVAEMGLVERADHHVGGLQLVEGLGRRGVPQRHHHDDGVVGAEPVKLAGDEKRMPEPGSSFSASGKGVGEQDLAAVLGRGRIDVVAGDHAAGARHVLDDEAGGPGIWRGRCSAMVRP